MGPRRLSRRGEQAEVRDAIAVQMADLAPPDATAELAAATRRRIGLPATT
jgi:hypothetical protein